MGLFSKIKDALKKTSEKISISITGDKIDEIFVRELEDALISADVGIETTGLLLSKIVDRKFPKGSTESDVKNFLAEEITSLLKPYESSFLSEKLEHNPHVVLLIGVNGNGKTTTSAKIAHIFKNAGHRPLLVAADTFRAAATEQLQYWSKVIDVPICSGKEKADAAGVVFFAMESAKQNKNDVVLVDTAGRMQNRDDLLGELEKIKRVVKKIDSSAPHTVILVLDGFTGQATHSQVEVFLRKIGIDGVIITKLDGTSKGGALISLTRKYKTPVFAVGIGEELDDLRQFNASEFAKAIVGA